VKLTAHNGKQRAFSQELATPGCDPVAKVKVRKRRRSFTLAAVVKAAKRGPDLTAVRVKLPKQLKRGVRAPRVLIDRKKAKAGHPRRTVRPKLAGGARRVKIVWKGLKRRNAKRKLAKTLTVPVTLTDKRGKTTKLRLRVERE
jgi:hypothetical protein